MPTVNVFGMEIERKKLFIGGAVIAAAVAVIVFLRARAAAAGGAAAAPQPAADQGGGMTVSAPTQGVADDYQQQLQNAQLQAANIGNQYQQQLMTQQQKQFDFQLSQEAALAPAYQSEQAAQLGAQAHYYNTVAKTRISCPGNQGVAQSPDGQLYCRQKTSGGILGIPVGDVFRTIQNFVGGVEAAAPTIGYQTAQEAARYYTGQMFSGGNIYNAAQAPQTVPYSGPSVPMAPGVKYVGPPAPSQPGSAIGYEGII